MRYDVAIDTLAPRAIVELRGDPSVAAQVFAAAGCTAPDTPNRCARSGDREVMWIGPRRWLVFAPAAAEQSLAALSETAASEPLLAAALVSDMYDGIAVDRPGWRDVIAQGTPLDLDALADDAATMTEMFGVAALLRRGAASADGVELWVDRSLTRYLIDCLDAAVGKPG
jgi:heterotetrameric sarcosine oxidase gamma subunit